MGELGGYFSKSMSEVPLDGVSLVPHLRRPGDPAEWEVQFKKMRRLGTDVDPRSPHYLVVLEVGDGALKDFNAQHPDVAIREGDQITCVNGVSDARGMLDCFRRSSDFRIRVRRPLRRQEDLIVPPLSR